MLCLGKPSSAQSNCAAAPAGTAVSILTPGCSSSDLSKEAVEGLPLHLVTFQESLPSGEQQEQEMIH